MKETHNVICEIYFDMYFSIQMKNLVVKREGKHCKVNQ